MNRSFQKSIIYQSISSEVDYLSIDLFSCFDEEFSTAQTTEDPIKEIRNYLFNHFYRSEHEMFTRCDSGYFTGTAYVYFLLVLFNRF